MADRNIAAACGVDKPTFIYGLVDPRTHQLRYIGKTVLSPERRLVTHVWRARTQPLKRHSMAWLLGLERAGIAPEIVVIEVVSPGQDWVEAEQFWIGYFRMIGADLCNHTDGGDGVPGLKRSQEAIEKLKASLPRGEKHHRHGKPMPPAISLALAEGGRKLRSDPIRNANAIKARRAGMTAEAMAPSIAGLQRVNADPVKRASARAKADEKNRTNEARARVSAQSAKLWTTKRDEIIAAQNAGKGEEWKSKQSSSKKAAWAVAGNAMAAAMKLRRKLTDEDLLIIRARMKAGEKQTALATEFGVHQSAVSMAFKRRKL